MRRTVWSRTCGLLIVPAMCLGLLLAGCEEGVDPVLEIDEPYTMYGLLAPTMDTQWVRVFPIENTLEERGPGPLDAVVTSTNLTTGEVRTWHDSVIVTRNGLHEHAFWSDFNAQYGSDYRVEVRRSDGASTFAHVKVPIRTAVKERTDEIKTTPPVLIPVEFSGNVPQLLQPKLVYLIQYARDQFATVSLDFEGDDQYLVQGSDTTGKLLTVNLTMEHQRIRVQLLQQDVTLRCGFAISNMNFYYLVTSADWDPPGGVFDPEILGMPGIMDNVEQGYGFIGSGYRDYYPLNVPDAALKAAGFMLSREMTTCN